MTPNSPDPAAFDPAANYALKPTKITKTQRT